MQYREKRTEGLKDNWKEIKRVPDKPRPAKNKTLLSRIAGAISAERKPR